MECDVAVLGGGPGGYTAAIRAAQLGAKVRLHRAGARARRHLPPRRLYPDEGVGADRSCAPSGGRGLREVRRQRQQARARLRPGGRMEERRREADDGRGRQPLQDERGRVGQGPRPLHRPEHDRRRGRRGRHVQERDRRHRLLPAHASDRRARLAPLRRLHRPARADRDPATARDPRRRHHRLRVRFDLPALRHRGDGHRDARDADPAGGRRRGEGAREAVRQARDRTPARQAVHRCPGRRLAADRVTSARARACRPT